MSVLEGEGTITLNKQQQKVKMFLEPVTNEKQGVNKQQIPNGIITHKNKNNNDEKINGRGRPKKTTENSPDEKQLAPAFNNDNSDSKIEESKTKKRGRKPKEKVDEIKTDTKKKSSAVKEFDEDDNSAYLSFRKKCMKKFSEKHPEIDKKQQLEIIIKKWGKMSTEQRELQCDKKSDASAKSDKPAKKVKESKKEKKKAKEDKIKKPKRVTSAQFQFLEKRRAELKNEGKIPEGKCSETIKLLATEWHSLSEEDKIPYNKLSEKDRKRYESELNQMNIVNTNTNNRKVEDSTHNSSDSNGNNNDEDIIEDDDNEEDI